MGVVGQGATEVDPAVLSTFAPSVQYQMLLKMREQQQAANRVRFQERAGGAPQDFSVLQMQTFLKASKFRCSPASFHPSLRAPCLLAILHRWNRLINQFFCQFLISLLLSLDVGNNISLSYFCQL